MPQKALWAGTAVLLSNLILLASAPVFASGDHGGHGPAFGEPASAETADRTVRIVASDRMTFEPASIAVQPGETVQFVVENPGDLQHSFKLGKAATQQEHAQDMQGMPPEKMADHMRSDPTGVVVQPGEQKRLTWRFKNGGAVTFACHVPGHYAAGMKGTIRVEREIAQE